MALRNGRLEEQDGHVGVRLASARSDDAPLIARLQLAATRAAYGRIFPPAAPQPHFEDVLVEWRDRLGGVVATAQTTLVAVDDGPIVGVVVVGPDPGRPDRGHLARFYVAPDRWGQGVGGRLYWVALGWFARGGYREATLWVLERNDRARAWHERLGWRTTGERKVVYEPAGIVELLYLTGVTEPLGRPGGDADPRLSRDSSIGR
jgi:GNAT superfamily N-acetyltransferase